MFRRILIASLLLSSVTVLVAAPIKSGSDTVTDRKGFIPYRKQEALPGKVVGVLLPNGQPVLSTEGRSGPPDSFCFSANGCSYRWVYVPVGKNPLIGSLNVRVGKGLEVKKFDNLGMANPETVKQWDVPGTYSLVEIEVNGGLGSPPDDSFVATKMRRLDGTAEFPLKLDEVMSDLKRKYDDYLREQASPIDVAMGKAAADAIKDRKPTGPRERNDLTFVTWMPETEKLRVHFRTTVTDGDYKFANNVRIDMGPAAGPAARPTAVGTRLPNGLKYGTQFGVELGMAFEVSKSGKVEKTLLLPMESFKKELVQPAVLGPGQMRTMMAPVRPALPVKP